MTLFLFDSTELKLHTYIVLRYFEYYLGLSYVYSTIYMSNTKGGGELFAFLPSILLLIIKKIFIYTLCQLVVTQDQASFWKGKARIKIKQ